MIYLDAEKAINVTREKLYHFGSEVSQETWQSVKSPDNTWELLNHSLSFPMRMEGLSQMVKPNQPWADYHFGERVGGEPLNPGNTYSMWPFFRHVGEDFKATGRFSHSYMERYWPKHAWDPDTRPANGVHVGIRFKYGDLNDVIKLLVKNLSTRQAYLPVWFPEDTGVVHGQRVPCSLGYHFIVRNELLHVNYYIRSCDYIRHFRDDIYLTVLLTDWIRRHINDQIDVQLGVFTMHITSLHCFKNEKELILKK